MFKQLAAVQLSALLLFTAFLSSNAFAANYVIDTKGAHASIKFRVQHLGYSWLYGRFNRFSGDFTYDEKSPNASKVSVTIDTGSVDSNHGERDKHLRSDDFLDVKKFPEARFVSTKIESKDDGTAMVYGNLTLKDVTKEVALEVEKIGAGPDPWGGNRAGFEGRTTFKMKDFNILKNLGPLSQDVEMILSIEGVRQ